MLFTPKSEQEFERYVLLERLGAKEVYQMSFFEFYQAFHKPAARLRKQAKYIQQTLKAFLRQVHMREVLKAVRKDLTIPLENLQAYQFFPAAAKEIKNYAKRRDLIKQLY
jgi:hypothetical protein